MGIRTPQTRSHHPGGRITQNRQDALLVEPAHPKEDDEANQRRFKAEVWREHVDVPGGRLRSRLQTSPELK